MYYSSIPLSLLVSAASYQWEWRIESVDDLEAAAYHDLHETKKDDLPRRLLSQKLRECLSHGILNLLHKLVIFWVVDGYRFHDTFKFRDCHARIRKEEQS